MFALMVAFHTLVCILLVIVVLMQSSKGEGLAGAFGGGGSGLTGAVFGGRGAASFLSKSTTILAIVFMINCGALAYMSSHRAATQAAAESAVTQEAAKELQRQQQQQQANPAPAGQPGAGTQTAPVGQGGELPPATNQPTQTTPPQTTPPTQTTPPGGGK